MHELGVVFHVIKIVEEVVAENELTQVSSVTLELGEVSTVIESYLQNCWKWATKKREMFDNCQLVVENLPAISYCEDCKESYSTLQYGKICPNCGSEHTYLLQGNEFIIKEIEVE